jgi:hypothetical protein
VEILQQNMETQKSALSHYHPKVEIGYSSIQATIYATVARMNNRGSTVIQNAKLT